jgi:hypothetical protein
LISTISPIELEYFQPRAAVTLSAWARVMPSRNPMTSMEGIFAAGVDGFLCAMPAQGRSVANSAAPRAVRRDFMMLVLV